MRLAKDQMNLKAKIKQLQGVKNVSLQIAILRDTISNSQGYTYMYVLPSVGIWGCIQYVTLNLVVIQINQSLQSINQWLFIEGKCLLGNSLYKTNKLINCNCCFCLIRLMMYLQQQRMVIKRVNRVLRH